MKRQNTLQEMSVDELVSLFTEIALKQYEAVRYIQTAKYNRLFKDMRALKDELTLRGGDQRRALTSLYTHPNVQVRLAAAHANLALAYTEARNVIQEIADSGEYPQAGDAAGTLRNLDSGFYKPV